MKKYFYSIKLETSFANIVRASKVHVVVQYGVIWANYAMDVAKTLVTRSETLERL